MVLHAWLIAATLLPALSFSARSNRTVYRLTPINVSGVTNMDSGDAMGDTFFFAGDDFNNPYSCRRDPHGGKCANGTGHELLYKQVYRQMILSVDLAESGPYAECNPPENGTWGPFTCRSYCGPICCAEHHWKVPCKDASSASFGNTTVGAHEPSAKEVCPGSKATNVSRMQPARERDVGSVYVPIFDC